MSRKGTNIPFRGIIPKTKGVKGLSELIGNTGILEIQELAFLTALPEPYRTILVYAIFMIMAFFACVLLAWVLKFLLKFIFHQIRFFACLIIAILLIGSFLIKSAVAPIQCFFEETGVGNAMALAVDKFKGLYSDAAPLLAWRFTDITEQTNDAMSAFEEHEEEQQDEAADKVRIRIDYLPAGSVVVVYDKEKQSFSIDKSIGDD
jgi:energy-coupling factor transporter transmembrane protein EcfT